MARSVVQGVGAWCSFSVGVGEPWVRSGHGLNKRNPNSFLANETQVFCPLAVHLTEIYKLVQWNKFVYKLNYIPDTDPGDNDFCVSI
jgi:hypothetical protein